MTTTFHISFLLTLIVVLHCGCEDSDPLERDITRWIALTTPPGSELIHRENLQRDSHLLQTGWAVKWNADWDAYTESTKKALSAEFTLIEEGRYQVAFRHTTDTDIFYLTMERSDPFSGEVLFSLVGYPF